MLLGYVVYFFIPSKSAYRLVKRMVWGGSLFLFASPSLTVGLVEIAPSTGCVESPL